jgi:TfoX/Sxy family transcriptional regulator of competence genes
MSAPRDEYHEHILERLEVVEAVRTTRLFGGVGIRLSDVQFGIMTANVCISLSTTTRAGNTNKPRCSLMALP